MPTHVVDAETWFRHRGMPQVLPLSLRARAALGHAAPVLAGLLVLDVAWQLIGAAWDELDVVSTQNDLDVATYALVLLAVLLLAPLAAALVAGVTWRSTRASPRAARVVGVLCLLGWIGIGSFLAAQSEGGDLGASLLVRVGWGVTVLVLVVLGLGSLLHWALRRSLLELWSVGPMVLRVLPVLMVAVLFLFFNAEIWQVSAGLNTVRTLGVAGVLAALAVLVVIVTARDELRSDVESHSPAARDLLVGTPFAGTGTDGGSPRLRLGERLNFLLVPIAAQSIQVAVFGAVMFAFFVGFGKLAISDAVATSWTAAAPTPLQFLDVPLGVSVQLVRVSLILASFCALSFAASASTDRAYRAAFLDPILHEARVNLAARHAYRRALAGANVDPRPRADDEVSRIATAPGGEPRPDASPVSASSEATSPESAVPEPAVAWAGAESTALRSADDPAVHPHAAAADPSTGADAATSGEDVSTRN